MGKIKHSFFCIFIIVILSFVGFRYQNLILTERKGELLLQKETIHFKYYSQNKDFKCINDLNNALENNYNKITMNFHCKLQEKIDVEIYPNIDSFHKSINQPLALDSVVGEAGKKCIKIVSPQNPGSVHNYDSMMKVAVHEFTHVITLEINPNYKMIPAWLIEGIAIYEANQVTPTQKKIIREKILQYQFISIDNLDKNFSKISGNYYYSYSLVDYIINTFGYEMIIKLIKSPNEITTLMNLSMDDIENQWIIYITKKY